MASREQVGGAGISAAALFAGLLTGSLLRTGQVPSESRAPMVAPTTQNQSRAALLEESSLKQMRPVMELLGQSLATSIDLKSDVAAASAALADLEETSSGNLEGRCGEQFSQLARMPSTTKKDEEKAPKNRRYKERLLELASCGDRDGLTKLVMAAHKAVSFLIATIPDYVDSSSGWRADQVIDAIQSGSSAAGYALDRFRLIDWVPVDQRSGAPDIITNSKLHEKQPGALIFRKYDANRPKYLVVLAVLETPTSGIHFAALHNAIEFIRAWNAEESRLFPSAPPVERVLRVLGPGFSGATVSLASELSAVNPQDFCRISVISGSAAADDNYCVMQVLAPGVTYEITTRTTSQTLAALKRQLGLMNPDWGRGLHVALLSESNTSFGQNILPSPLHDSAFKQCVSKLQTDSLKLDPNVDGTVDGARQDSLEKFTPEFTFKFPLHIAQLMSDAAPVAPVAISLLAPSAVPLSLSERTAPADQIPALRPQLTSPMVESELRGIIASIYASGVTAVGIVATDERDVLFLARLLKRQAPNIQLFFAGSNLLYLHSDYVPYVRGALVASAYPLHLQAQRGFQQRQHTSSASSDDGSPLLSTARRSFPSMVAEGTYNATVVHLGRPDLVLDYCNPILASETRLASSRGPCVPPVWVSVVGDDGFWPVTWTQYAASRGFVPLTMEATQPLVAMLPASTRVIAAVLLAVLVAHVGILLFLWRASNTEADLKRHQQSAFLRILSPPITYPSAARMHSLARVFAMLILACLGAWLTAILALHWTLSHHGTSAHPIVATIASAFCFVAVAAPGVLTFPLSDRLNAVGYLPNPKGPWAPTKKTSMLALFPALVLLVGTLVFFGLFLGATLLWPGIGEARLSITLERYASGSMVSPAATILCLLGAAYAGVVTGLRRIALLGNGYAALAAKSPAFGLLAGAPRAETTGACAGAPAQAASGRSEFLPLVSLLDMPAQNLPWPYAAGLLALLATILWAAGRPSTVDGWYFSWFLLFASALVLSTAFLLLAQAIEIWRKLRPGLIALSHSRIEPALGSVARVIRWNLTLVTPHLSDLVPVASLADRLYSRLVSLASATAGVAPPTGTDRRARVKVQDYLRSAENGALRKHDLDEVVKIVGSTKLQSLMGEMREQQYAPLLQSKTWFEL